MPSRTVPVASPRAGLSTGAPGTRLIVAGAAVTILLAAFGIALAIRGYDRERARVIAETETLARASAANASQFARGSLDLLAVLAVAPPVQAGDPAAMRPYLLANRPAERGLSGGLAWFDRDGRLRVATAGEVAAGEGAPTPDYVRQTLATGAPTSSGATVAPLDGRPAVVLAVPTRDEAGRPNGVLTGAIGTDRLEQTTRRLPFGPGSATWVLDRDGRVLAAPEGRQAGADIAATPLWARLRPWRDDPARGSVLTDVAGVDGTPNRLTGFGWTPVGDWLIVVERPLADALGRLQQTLATEILALVGAAALCLGVLARVGTGANRLAAAERAAQRQYRTLAEVAPVGIFHADARGDYTYVNDRWCAIAGVAPAAALGDGWTRALHPDDRERVTAAWVAALAGELPFTAEYRFRRAEGAPIWVLGQAAPERDATGAIVGWVGTITDITAREEAAAALRASEEKFAATFALSPLAISLTSIPEGRFLEVNEALLRLTGYSREEVLGRTPIEVGMWADPADWATGRQRILREDRIIQGESRFRRKDGSILTGLVSASRISLAAGEALLTVVADITAREEAEARARGLAEISATLAGTLDEGAALDALAGLLVRDLAEWCVIGTLEADGQIHRRALAHRDPASEATLRRLPPAYPNEPGAGWGAAQVIATGEPVFRPHLTLDEWLVTIRPDDHEPFRALGVASAIIVPLRARGRTFGALSLLRATPGRPYVEADLALAEQIADRTAITIDSARLYAAERAARAAAEAAQGRLALLAEAGATLAGSLDYEATLAALSRLIVPAFADWCTINLLDEGGALRPLVARHAHPERQDELDHLLRRYPASAQGEGPLAIAMRTGESALLVAGESGIIPVNAPDGDYLALLRAIGFASTIIVPLRARGRLLGVLRFARGDQSPCYDTSDLALAEELAGRAALALDNARLYGEARDAVAARDRFLSIAAHELRTPLTSVRAYAQLIRRQARRDLDPEALARSLDAIERGTGRLDVLIQDLLDVARLQAGQLQVRHDPLDLVPLVERIVAQERLHLPDGLGLAVDLAPSSYTVLGDAGRLEQVLANLLENARKYSPDGGTVTVSLAADPRGATIAVRDEGIGLGPGDAERIFTPFSRSEEALRRQIPGLGLGLAICRAIVEQHGGTLRAEGAGEGRGTTFLLWLPAPAGEVDGAGEGVGGEAQGVVVPARGTPD